jgi:hypothetical protein
MHAWASCDVSEIRETATKVVNAQINHVICITPVTVNAGRTRLQFERDRAGDALPSSVQLRGEVFVGKHARVGLLLAGTCCLLAVMVDWIVEEL